MRRLILLLLFASPAMAQYGGVFASSPPIAQVSVTPTAGNSIASDALGIAEPSTNYLWWGRTTHCGTAGLPNCGINLPLEQLMKNWTNLHSRQIFWRIEMDPQHPYDFQCYNIPVGTAITGGWSTVGGTATFTTPNSFAVGNTVYLHSFSSAAAITAGLNNPSTPQAATTAYTIAAATSTQFSVAISYTGTQSGTDAGYATLASQWYPNIPTCPSGLTLVPPTSALLDGVVAHLAANPLLNVSLGLDLQSSQYVNGHRWGPLTGTTAPVAIAGYSPVSVPMWTNALASYSTSTLMPQLKAFELGNEPDNYASEVATGFWGYRATTWPVFTQGINYVHILQPGSGQTAGVYNIAGVGGTVTGDTVDVTVSGGVCTTVAVHAAGTGGYGGAVPTFTMPSSAGGTPCTIEAQMDGLFNNFDDASKAITAAGGTGGKPFFFPSTAGNLFSHWAQIGGANTLANTTASTPTTPNELSLISDGLGIMSQHQYPGGKSNFCPAYPVSSITRVGSGYPATSSTTLTTSQPTNFQTAIALASETYSSSSLLVTATLSDLDTITSHSWANNIVTMNTSGTPGVVAGQVIQPNGFTVDTLLNGQPLQVLTVGSSSYTASWPLFTDSSSDTGSGYDQLFIYAGASAATTGVTSTNSSMNYSFTIAGSSPKVHPATFTMTTTGSGHTVTDTTGSGGSLNMTALPANITGTPLGGSGSSLDLTPVASCSYSYPPTNTTSCGYPFYGTHSTTYASSNFNQLGTQTITATSPTSFTFQMQGPADSTNSGVLTLVTGTASNSTINVPKSPNCNPQDILLLPALQTKSSTLNAPFLSELDNLQILTGGLSTPQPNRLGEFNSFSPGQHGITDTIQQALWGIGQNLTLMTFNGANGTTGSTGQATSAPFSGFDGGNWFWGEATVYSFYQFKFSPACSSGSCTFPLQDVTTNTGPAVQGGYYGMMALFDFMPPNSSWLPVSSVASSSSIKAWALIDSQSPAHVHVMLLNNSEGVSGAASVSVPGYTSGTSSLLSSSTPVLTFNPTVTALSGSTATFTVPASLSGLFTGDSANLMYLMPLTLSGYTSNAWLNGQQITVLTHSGTTMTALVTPGALTAGEAGTATESCQVGTPASPTPLQCTWGVSYAGQTWDGSPDGNPVGVLTKPSISAASGVFSVQVPKMSAVVLDLTP